MTATVTVTATVQTGAATTATTRHRASSPSGYRIFTFR
jgi:hypothetical protein